MIKNMLVTGWGIFTLLVLISSWLLLICEQDAYATTIHTYSDALWWMINVSSAVGDCELYPVTFLGRAISTVMMVVGYALFGINVSAIVSLIHKHNI